MALFDSAVAAATGVLGYDHLSNEPYRSAARLRRLRAVGLVGSVNPGDMGLEIKIGTTPVCKVYNSRGGANLVPNKDDMIPVDAIIPPNAGLSAPIFDAGATNQTVLRLDIVG